MLDIKDANKVIKNLRTRPYICSDDYIELDNGYIIARRPYFKELEDRLKEYQAIGTPEECQEAMKRQKPMLVRTQISESDFRIGNIIFRKGTKIHRCPCGKLVSLSCKFCTECGQKLDWGEYDGY